MRVTYTQQLRNAYTERRDTFASQLICECSRGYKKSTVIWQENNLLRTKNVESFKGKYIRNVQTFLFIIIYRFRLLGFLLLVFIFLVLSLLWLLRIGLLRIAR